MKNIVFSSAALFAALMISSCSKEQPVESFVNEGSDLVPMSFVASVEADGTKAALEADGKTVSWEGNESIAVFDNVSGDIHKFDAEGAGATTSFTGSVSSGASSFVAVYPYSEDIVYTPGESSPILMELPSVQDAVLGGFDPKAAVYVATSADLSAKLAFKACFALVKVNVDIDNVTGVLVEAKTKYMSGSVKVSTGGGIGDGTGTRVRNVALRKPDGTVLAKGEYYIVVRHLGSSGTYTDFTVTYVKSDAKGLSRTASSDMTPTELGRKCVLNIGNLSGFPGTPQTNRYLVYQTGANVVLGGETYNRAIYGEAVELDPAVNISDSRLSAKVHFLKAGANYTTSGLAMNKELIVLAGEDPENVSVVKNSSAWKLQSGTLVADGLGFDLSALTSSSAIFMNNSGATEDFESLVVSKCRIAETSANPWYLFNTNSGVTDVGIKNVLLADNVFVVDSKVKYFIGFNSNHVAVDHFKNMEFRNNVICSKSTTNRAPSLFYSSASKANTTGYDDVKVKITGNIFYNAAATAGTYRSYSAGDIQIKDNVYYVTDGQNFTSSPKVVHFSIDINPGEAPYTGFATHNLAYGTMTGGGSWTIASSKYSISMFEAFTIADEDPFETADYTTGTFVLKPAYSSYGPQAE
ncbi:MAG: hypothetical protein IJ222_09995 [Bacteroidales bacterium]|nr:hypothetical protein [Bacteroidales bacterium]